VVFRNTMPKEIPALRSFQFCTMGCKPSGLSHHNAKGILALKSFTHNAKRDTGPKIFSTPCHWDISPVVFCDTMSNGIPALRSFTHNAKGDTSPKVFHAQCKRGYRPKALSPTMPKGIPALKS
jgi:hypothetical protein